MIEKLLNKLGYVDELLLIESEKQYDALRRDLSNQIDSLLEQNIMIGESIEAYKLADKKLRKRNKSLENQKAVLNLALNQVKKTSKNKYFKAGK